MPEDASKKKYAYLDHLSTAELEEMLCAAVMLEESDDSAMMDYLLEVIVKREQETNNLPGMDRMREDFETLYRGLEEPLYPSEEESSSESHTAVSIQPSKRKTLRRIIMVAALLGILIALTCIPVLGHANVVHLMAYWTAEQFGFQVADRVTGDLTRQSNQQLLEEYQELQTALDERGFQFSVPEFPEGFEPEEPFLYIDPTTGNIDFSIMYMRGKDYISFDIIQNEGLSSTKYEKNSSDVEQYMCAGIIHYIFNNYDGTMITTWVNNSLEYCISTNSKSIEIKQVIQSMYKE